MIEILTALLMSVIYTIIGYAKSVDEEFNPTKAVSTIILGLIIGTILTITGSPVTQASVAAQLVTYGGLLYVIENILKAIWRRL